MGDKRVNSGFQLAFPTCTRFFCLVLCIALSLAALAGDDDGQAIFPAQLVAHVPYAVIAPFVGIVFVMVYEVYGTENNVIVDMITERNNLHDVDTWMFFKWFFKGVFAMISKDEDRSQPLRSGRKSIRDQLKANTAATQKSGDAPKHNRDDHSL